MMPKNPIRLWSSCVFSIVVKTKEVSKIRKLLRCFEVCFPCCSCEISDNLPLADDCREVFVRSIFKGAFRGLPRLKLLSVRFAYRNILHISRISIFTCTLSLYKVPIMLELIDTSVQGRQIFWSPGFYPALSCY